MLPAWEASLGRRRPLDVRLQRLLIGRHEKRRRAPDGTETLDVLIERAQILLCPAIEIEPGHGWACLEGLGERDPLGFRHVGHSEAQVARIRRSPRAVEPERAALEPLA